MDGTVDCSTDAGIRPVLEQIEPILRNTYGSPKHHNLDDPLSELVFIILSSRTPEGRYLSAYQSLCARFPVWSDILNCSVEEIASTIRHSGLEQRKARDIHRIMTVIRDNFGTVSLNALRSMDDESAERFLIKLPGVGLKSARCVLMFSLGREVLPVDTHVWRIVKRLGIARGGRTPSDRQANELQDAIPKRLRHSLHVNLIAHGRAVCRETNPGCITCPIAKFCAFYRGAERMN